MIDAFNITRYSRSKDELQLFILFAVMVAGKNAETTDKACDRMWRAIWKQTEFEYLGNWTAISDLKAGEPFTLLKLAIERGWVTPEALKGWGFGCYNHRYRSIKAFLTGEYTPASNRDLHTYFGKVREVKLMEGAAC